MEGGEAVRPSGLPKQQRKGDAAQGGWGPGSTTLSEAGEVKEGL